eukprot:Nitzschia sp. Nitz4//scaffold111_size72815//20200//23123//NITZ4_005783-RA/size72815-snap-gene-0.97-mRNA-1//1//CDS//3329533159//7982//frame0
MEDIGSLANKLSQKQQSPPQSGDSHPSDSSTPVTASNSDEEEASKQSLGTSHSTKQNGSVLGLAALHSAAIFADKMTPSSAAGVKKAKVSTSSRKQSNDKGKFPSKASQSYSHPSTNSAILTPGLNDIISGRGRGFFNHPGNRRMLQIVADNKERYRAANKTRKTEIVKEITIQIEDEGARFLRRESGDQGWYELTLADKHRKVCHCLREEKRIRGANNSLSDGALAMLDLCTADPSSFKNIKRETPPGNDEDSTNHVESNPSQAEGEETPSTIEKKTSAQEQPDTSTPTGRSVLDILGMAAAMQMKKDETAASVPEPDKVPKDTPLQRGAVHPSTQDHAEYVATPPVAGSTGARMGGTAPPPTSALTGVETNSSRAPASQYSALGRLGGFRPSGGLTDQLGIILGEPRPMDVLFGQDPTFYSHEGNIRLRDFIQRNAVYPPSSTEHRLVLTRGITTEIKLAGGNFLTRPRHGQPGVWYRINDIEAETLIFRCIEEEEAKMKAVLTGTAEGNVSGSGPGLAYLGIQPAGSQPGERHVLGSSEASPSQPGQGNAASGAIEDDDSSSSSASSEDDDEGTEDGQDKVPDDERNVPKSSSPIDEPGENDVVCGRGRGNFIHPGNRKMLRMFWDVKSRYNSTNSKFKKTMIGREIIREIRGRGGRFIRRGENGLWVEADPKVVLRKVCHGIRDIPNDPAMRKRSIVAVDDRAEAAAARKEKKRRRREEKMMQRAQAGALSYDRGQYQEPRPTDLSPLLKASESVAGAVVEVPNDLDVLSGRGRGNFGHPGNRRMLQIISFNTARYRQGSKAAKGKVARDVLAEIQSIGARFLKREDNKSNRWVVCDQREALQKVCHGIRDTISNIENKKMRKDLLKELKAKAGGEDKYDEHDDDGSTNHDDSVAGPESLGKSPVPEEGLTGTKLHGFNGGSSSAVAEPVESQAAVIAPSS